MQVSKGTKVVKDLYEAKREIKNRTFADLFHQYSSHVAGRPCGSVAQLARVLAQYARGPGFVSRWGHVLFLPVTFGGSLWVCARAASSKDTVSSVPAQFQADSGTNLFKQWKLS